MSATHHKYTEIVNRIAENPWGADYESDEEAEKYLLNDTQKLNAFATVELLKRLNAIGAACAPKKDTTGYSYLLDSEKSAKLFPNKKVGDFLYEAENCKVTRSVIVAKDKEQRCLIIEADHYSLEDPHTVHIAQNHHYETIKEASAVSVEIEIDYHQPGLKLAMKVKKALEDDTDLTEYHQWGKKEKGEEQ